MKRHLLIGTSIIMLSLANVAYADFFIHSSDLNTCPNIAGQWNGTGVLSNWLIGSCLYHGTGKIGNVDNVGHFTLDVAAEKESGSIVCPQSPTVQLAGTCVDGNVTISTSYGNLTGNMSGNQGDAKGTLTISPGITVDVNIQFQYGQ